LAKALKKSPDADLNKDGTLTREEFNTFRKLSRTTAPPTGNPLAGAADVHALAKSFPRYPPAQLAERFTAQEFDGVRYRFFIPTEAKPEAGSEQKFPLVLSLHGAGGKGDDNLANLKNWNGTMTEPEFQQAHPCFIVVPQSSGPWRVPADDPALTDADIGGYPEAWQNIAGKRAAWMDRKPDGNLDRVFALLDSLAGTYPIDIDRVYVLGHSMGGFGSFEAIAQQPHRFAAAIPSAGGLLPWHDVRPFAHVPIWAFHGDRDTTVPYDLSRTAFEQVKAAGGNMKLTRLGGVDHGAAAFAFVYSGDEMHENFVTLRSGDQCDPTANVWDWLFARRRAER